ncbi:MAG: MBL fold metallo-hydrolase [Lachnospiraceae bacterium]|nr:MBL fold metallo-hydrolase [Lachnospiraceae bacterium]
MELSKNTVTIYRGSQQIGGCATEIATENHRIIIDFGANLPDTENTAVSDEELAAAVFDGRPCDGVMFSHYHGDHIGLYKKIPQNVPMYIGKTAKKLLKILTERLDKSPRVSEKGLPIIQKMYGYSPNKKLIFGDITVTPYVVDHSALDAYMFLVEVGSKRILFTGDFREHGIAGENNRLEKLLGAYVHEVDILITEGTMLSRIDETKHNPILTESDLGKRAAELFRENKQSVILVSSTNLDSIMEFYQNLPPDMAFVCDAYQARLMLTAMADKGLYYPEYLPKIINGKPRVLHIVGDLDSLGEKENCRKADFHKIWNSGFTMLARTIPLFAGITKKLDDPLIIYSMWTGYLSGKHHNPKITEFIGEHRTEILHTSGHAYVETLEKLIRLTKPKTVIPMHTECADKFAELPEFAPYRESVKALKDGEKYFF